jgi:sugar/nucleoside kinase (ribokinase family)
MQSKMKAPSTVSGSQGIAMHSRNKEHRPTLVTAGFVALDIVFGLEHPEPRIYAGGTCGNVVAALAFLGWDASPLARLGDDAAGRVIRSDLARWGVNTKYLDLDPVAPSPIVLEKIERGKNGLPKHRFLWNCPDCGAYFPPYRAILRSQLSVIQESIDKPDVFFTDRVSSASVELARHYHAKGSIIYFEPSGTGDPKLFREMLKHTTVLKYSSQRARSFSDLLRSHKAQLEIETLGEDGLRFRLRRSSSAWHSLPAHEVAIKDTSGSGDWTTVGLLSSLFRDGKSTIATASKVEITRALEYGQAIAALNCQFEGARGAMYQLSRAMFLKGVGIIESKVASSSKELKISLSRDISTSVVCPRCSPKKHKVVRQDAKSSETHPATRLPTTPHVLRC